jgi:ADP-ribose pyrophosphatase
MTGNVRPRTIYQGRVFRLDQELATIGNARRITVDVIRHRGSVVLIPEPGPGKVILIRQYRHVIRRWIWELPAGTLDAGERLDHAARRECEEEIGLTPTRLTRLGAYYPTPGFCDELMVFYRCRGLVAPKRGRAPDEDELIEPKTFTIARAWSLVRAGDIVDMKTVLGLAMIDGAVPRARRGHRRSAVTRD